MKYTALPLIAAAGFLSACNQAQPAQPDTQTDAPIEIKAAETTATQDVDTDADAPLDIQPLSLEKVLSPAEKAYAEHKSFYDIDERLQPIVDICGEAEGPYYPDYLLQTMGYQDRDTAAYKGSIFLQVASFSRGNIATETYFIPTDTLIVEALDKEIRIASKLDNVSGLTSGFRSDGTAEDTFDFEGVDLDRAIHCNDPEKAVKMLTDFTSGLNAPAAIAPKEIRYSVDIRSEVNLEGMCEYQHEDAKATIAETLSGLGLVPLAQLAVAPNNDMRIRLTPYPNTEGHSQNDCRYDIDIVRNWTPEPWTSTPARNQNYETGYELIFQSVFEIGEEFKTLPKN